MAKPNPSIVKRIREQKKREKREEKARRKLERVAEGKRKIHEIAKKAARGSKAALADAEEALENEIREQRFGPGPLFWSNS